MRNFPLLLCCALLLFSSSVLFAQSPTSYKLEIHSLLSEHGNTLGPVVSQSITNEWPEWEKVSNDKADYNIKVHFLNGLDAKQYIQKKISRRQYIYKVKYISPQYETLVTDRNGGTVLRNTYGGETIIVPFGQEDQYASPDTLASSWRKNRDAFYEIEESKYNNVASMLRELADALDDYSLPLAETTPIPTPSSDLIESEKQNNNELSREEQINAALLDITETVPQDNNSTTKEREEILEAPEINIVRKNPVMTEEPVFEEESTREITPETLAEAAQEETGLKNESESIATEIEETSNKEVDQVIPEGTPKTLTEVKEETKEVVVATIVEKEEKIKETPEERKARIEEIERQWAEMDKADEDKNKKPRVRHVRLGLRLLVPNIAGGHGEVVLPMLDNRISIVGDFSFLPFGNFITPLIEDEGQSIDELDASYQYLSLGANFYFRKKYARGWYVGSSYLKNIVKSSVAAEGENEEAKGKVDIDAAALRFGVNMGRKTFMFGFEVGAALPLSNLSGEIQIVEDGVTEIERINEKIPVIPILNITIGVAL